MSKKEDKKREETKKKILSEMKKEEFMKAIAKDLPEDINEQEFMQAIAEKLGDHMNINTDYDMNDDEDFDKSFAMFETLSKTMTAFVNTAMYHYTSPEEGEGTHPEQVLHTFLNAVLVQIFIRSPDDEIAKEIITDLTDQLDTTAKLANSLKKQGSIQSIDSDKYRAKMEELERNGNNIEMEDIVTDELTKGETIH